MTVWAEASAALARVRSVDVSMLDGDVCVRFQVDGMDDRSLSNILPYKAKIESSFSFKVPELAFREPVDQIFCRPENM